MKNSFKLSLPQNDVFATDEETQGLVLRSNVEDKYTWNLTDIFASPDEAASIFTIWRTRRQA